VTTGFREVFAEILARRMMIARLESVFPGYVLINIRQKLGLHPNTEVAFEIDGNAASIEKVRRARTREHSLVAHLKGKGTVRMSTDEILALTRK
jgi:hypothetical protein